MEQVKIISSTQTKFLEEKINEFLSENKDCISVKDIKYYHNPDVKAATTHSWFAMIRYEK